MVKEVGSSLTKPSWSSNANNYLNTCVFFTVLRCIHVLFKGKTSIIHEFLKVDQRMQAKIDFFEGLGALQDVQRGVKWCKRY